MPLLSRKSDKFFYAFGFAMLLQLGLWAWQLLPYNFVLEEEFQKIIQLGNKAIMPDGLSQADILLIDVGGSYAFTTADGSQQTITDRTKLDSLFRLIKRYGNPRLVICDLYFDLASPHDAALTRTMAGLPQLYCVQKTDGNGQIVPNLFHQERSAPVAFLSYPHPWLIFGNALIKFRPILANGQATLPLRLYEHYTSRQVSKPFLGIYRDQGLHLNTVSVQPHYQLDRDTAVQKDQLHPLDDYLVDLQQNRLAARQTLAGKKIILIGDFQKDIHGTAIGNTAGPLVVLNLFLSLLAGTNRLRLLTVLVTLLILTLLVLKRIYHGNYLISLSWYRKLTACLERVLHYFGYTSRPKFLLPTLLSYPLLPTVCMSLLKSYRLYCYSGFYIKRGYGYSPAGFATWRTTTGISH